MNERIPSMSRSSESFLCETVSKALRRAGVRMYFPVRARTEGEADGLGFSTKAWTSCSRSCEDFGSIIPYLSVSFLAIFVRPRIGVRCFSYCAISCFSGGVFASQMSSPKRTAKGSSWTSSLAQRIAWPSPSGNGWRT